MQLDQQVFCGSRVLAYIGLNLFGSLGVGVTPKAEMPAIKGDSCDNWVSGTAVATNDQPSLTTHPNKRKGQL